jgi:hypothetical protein
MVGVMRSDELVDRVRKAADIGSVAAWPDFPDSRILQELTERHCQLMGDEEVRARAGYGVQTLDLVCNAGQDMYPVPARAIGGAFEKLEVQPAGQLRFRQLDREEVSGSEHYDYGLTAATGTPTRYSVRDGWVQLYPPPTPGLILRFTFYIRPSQLVTSQCSTLGGDGVDRGRVIAFNTTLRTVTINAAPLDQLLDPPVPISPTYLPLVDIIRPSGTYALTIFDGGPYNFFANTFSLLGGRSMSRLAIGDYVRVADQTDWPMGLPVEAHRMVANRAAAEVARDIGVEEKVQMLTAVAEADLQRFRRMRSPQVKSQPVVIPLRPMQRR